MHRYRFVQPPKNELVALVDDLQVAPEQPKKEVETDRRLLVLFPVIVEDDDAPRLHQNQSVDGVAKHGVGLMVAIDIGEVEVVGAESWQNLLRRALTKIEMIPDPSPIDVGEKVFTEDNIVDEETSSWAQQMLGRPDR